MFNDRALRFLLANKSRGECKISKALDQDDDNDPDDLAIPGETIDADEDLRLEINLDKQLWNRLLI